MFPNLPIKIAKLQAELTTCQNHKTPDKQRIRRLKLRIVELKRLAKMYSDPDVRADARRRYSQPETFSDIVTLFNHVLEDRLAERRVELYMLAWGLIKDKPKTVVKGHLCLASSVEYPKVSKNEPPELVLVKS